MTREKSIEYKIRKQGRVMQPPERSLLSKPRKLSRPRDNFKANLSRSGRQIRIRIMVYLP